MLRILRSVVPESHEVIVIVDDPRDESVGVVKKIKKQYPEARWVLNRIGPGAKNAFRAGLAEAKGKAVLIFAADEVGPVLAIHDMLQMLEKGCDFISCTRYAHGGRRLGGSFLGGLLSRTANRLLRTTTSVPFSDATTGIKCFRKSVVSRLSLSPGGGGWSFAFELALKAHYEGLRLGEIPIISIDRLYGGQSSFRLLPWVREYGRWFWWALCKEKSITKPISAKRLVTAGLPLR